MSNFAALPGCIYNDEICLLDIEPMVIVCHPARGITEIVAKLFNGTPQNKGTAFEKHFLIFIDWNLFIKNERIQVSAVPDMPYQS